MSGHHRAPSFDDKSFFQSSAVSQNGTRPLAALEESALEDPLRGVRPKVSARILNLVTALWNDRIGSDTQTAPVAGVSLNQRTTVINQHDKTAARIVLKYERMTTSVFRIGVIMFLGLAAARSSRSATGPLDQWRRELPVRIMKLEFFKGEFIGSGSWASTDGRHWEQRLRGTDPFVLVSTGDDLVVPIFSRLYTSKDARTFAVRKLPPYARFEDLAYANGNYVGYWQQSRPGSTTGALMWSPDAQTWTMTASNIVTGSIEFANTNFFAWILLNSGGTYNWSRGTSTDGATWNFTAVPPGTPMITRLAYGKGVYVGVGAIQDGQHYTNVIATFTSPDEITIRRSSETDRYNDVLFDGNKFIVVGTGAFYSADGLAWQSGNILPNVHLQTVTHGNGLYVAARESSKYTSIDGINWTRQTEELASVPTIAFGQDKFVAFADTVTGSYALVSTNRNDWSFVDLPLTNRVAISIYAQDHFLGIGNGGAAVRSPDGFAWERFETGLPSAPLKLLFQAERFYALCQEGTNARIYSAQDPKQWQLVASLAESQVHSLAINDKTFVLASGAFPNQPVLNTSTNSGTTWTSFTLPHAIRDLVFVNGRFVGVGDYSYIVTSRDGLTWKEIQLTNKFLTRVQFGGGSFVAAGALNEPASGFNAPLESQDFFYSSTDGENWTKHYTGITGQVLGLAYGARTWVWGLTGSGLTGGVIMRSNPVIPNFRPEELQFAGKTAFFLIENPAGESYTLEVTADLRTWAPLTNTSATQIEVEQAADAAFFRLRQ